MSLDELIVNEVQHRGIVERLISPYLRFSPEGEVSFLDPWFETSAEKKVLLFLVCEEARRLLADKLPQRNGPVFPNIISGELGIPGNTVRPRLKGLRKLGFVRIDRSGGYSINIPMLSRMEKFLKGGDINER